MYRHLLRPKYSFCNKPPQIFSEDKLLGLAKIASIAMMVLMAGVSGYYYMTEEKRGRKRALDYEETNPRQPKPSILPDELQPEYIKEQRGKYQQILEDRRRDESRRAKDQ